MLYCFIMCRIKIKFSYLILSYIYSTYYTFLASSQLTTSIHWSCYCTAHVYVVIHFCDSMVFLSGTESVHVSFFLLCIAVGNPVIKKGV
jgi:hypothetical protein